MMPMKKPNQKGLGDFQHFSWKWSMYDFGKIKKFRQKDNKFFKKILQDYFDKKIYLKQVI